MPIIEVKVWEGMAKENKAKVIEGINRTFADIGVPTEHVHINIIEIPKDNWGTNGKQHSELFP